MTDMNEEELKKGAEIMKLYLKYIISDFISSNVVILIFLIMFIYYANKIIKISDGEKNNSLQEPLKINLQYNPNRLLKY